MVNRKVPRSTSIITKPFSSIYPTNKVSVEIAAVQRQQKEAKAANDKSAVEDKADIDRQQKVAIVAEKQRKIDGKKEKDCLLDLSSPPGHNLGQWYKSVY